MSGSFLSFEGRTDRSGYAAFLISWAAAFLTLFMADRFLLPGMTDTILSVAKIMAGLMILTGLPVSVRRLHDMGISGWAFLFILLTGLASCAMDAALEYFPQDLKTVFTENPGTESPYVWTMAGLFLFFQFGALLFLFWPGEEWGNKYG